MLYFVENLFEDSDARKIANQAIMRDKWKDGNITSTYADKSYKQALQLLEQDIPKTAEFIKTALMKNETILYKCFARKIHNIIFSRMQANMKYGLHSDTPFTSRGRRDLSFTLFLGDRDSFEGGELILYIPPESKTIKLGRGQAIIYPTKYIHEVKPVTSGERFVCVGWIESEIPEQEDREILSDLRIAISSVKEKNIFLTGQRAFNCLHKKLSK